MATFPTETIPRRLSPFHYRQASLGAKFTQDAFGWIRAESFTNPEEEKGTAKRGVGVGDLSHLAKISIKGKDVRQNVLDIYKNDKEPVNGIVMPKGPSSLKDVLCAFLCKDEAMFIMNPAMSVKVRKLLEDGSKAFALTDMTSVLAGLYILGEKSRSSLRKLAELNVNPEDFSNLTATYSPIRHVPSMIVRFDLEETVGFQIYFERAYSEYIWDSIFGAGREFGMIPVGSAAMRTLGWSMG